MKVKSPVGSDMKMSLEAKRKIAVTKVTFHQHPLLPTGNEFIPYHARLLAAGSKLVQAKNVPERKPISDKKRERILAENVKNRKAVLGMKRERAQAKKETGNKAVLQACEKLTGQVNAFNAQLNGIRLVMNKILKRLPE